MQLASILSDLTSFRLCGHAEALALVTASQPQPSQPSSVTSGSTSTPSIPNLTPSLKREFSLDREEDVDLRRAFDLMGLHKLVKLGLGQGGGRREGQGLEGLEKARRDVDAVVRGMGEYGR